MLGGYQKEKVFCFHAVRSLEKDYFLENSHILSCSVQLKSVLFNLLCVLDLFSKRWHSTLFQIFFYTRRDHHFSLCRPTWPLDVFCFVLFLKWHFQSFWYVLLSNLLHKSVNVNVWNINEFDFHCSCTLTACADVVRRTRWRPWAQRPVRSLMTWASTGIPCRLVRLAYTRLAYGFGTRGSLATQFAMSTSFFIESESSYSAACCRQWAGWFLADEVTYLL